MNILVSVIVTTKNEEKNLPKISVLIPTLNSASVLEGCLQSIVQQDYPKEKIEVIVADGGSTDKTIEIAKKYGAKIFPNPLKTGEAGKAVALRQTQGELVALIDSDNILPNKNWLKRMVAPFEDPEVIGSEPWEYLYRRQDCLIDRYCALMGMNDPLCYFLGNYDRKNVLSGKWTELSLQQKDKGDWIKIKITPPNIPTFGANGTILRRKEILQSKLVGDYLFDIDILAEMGTQKPIYFAKVKTEIVHLFMNGQGVAKFVRKQKRRVKDYLYYQKIGARKYPWQKQSKIGLLKFVFACVTVFPLIYQFLKGYFKRRDIAWFFHPLACWITLIVYFLGMISSYFSVSQLDRKGWKQ